MVSTSASTAKPTVFVLSLDDLPRAIFDDMYGRMMGKIANQANIKHATTMSEALDLFKQESKPKAVLVIDGEIMTRKNRAISDKLIEYVKNGGTAVFGGTFSSFVRPMDLGKYFKTKWELPWVTGSYHRTTVVLNPFAARTQNDQLSPSYSQKAQFLKNASVGESWYIQPPESTIQSLVFGPEPVSDTSESPAVFGKVGNGHLGYIGDVNAEEETDAVTCQMMGF